MAEKNVFELVFTIVTDLFILVLFQCNLSSCIHTMVFL